MIHQIYVIALASSYIVILKYFLDSLSFLNYLRNIIFKEKKKLIIKEEIKNDSLDSNGINGNVIKYIVSVNCIKMTW